MAVDQADNNGENGRRIQGIAVQSGRKCGDRGPGPFAPTFIGHQCEKKNDEREGGGLVSAVAEPAGISGSGRETLCRHGVRDVTPGLIQRGMEGSMRDPWLGAFAGALASVAIFLQAGCREKQEMPTPPPPEVTVARPLVREVIEWDE